MNPQATHRETNSSELTTSSMQPVMSPWQLHLHKFTSKKPTYSTFSFGRKYLILYCLGLTCLSHLSTKPCITNWVAVNILRAINLRGTRRMKSEFTLGIRSVSSILSRESSLCVTVQTLSIPVHRSMSVTIFRGGFLHRCLSYWPTTNARRER